MGRVGRWVLGLILAVTVGLLLMSLGRCAGSYPGREPGLGHAMVGGPVTDATQYGVYDLDAGVWYMSDTPIAPVLPECATDADQPTGPCVWRCLVDGNQVCAVGVPDVMILGSRFGVRHD